LGLTTVRPKGPTPEVFCALDTVIPDHAAPLGEGAFRLGAAGDQSRRIKNTTDDIATVMFRFSDGGAGHMSLSRVASGIRYDIGYDISGSEGTIRQSYARINDIQIYREAGDPEFRGTAHLQMGPTDPRFAALHPVSGLGLGYNDYKAIEPREMIVAAAEKRPGLPDFAFGYRIQRIVEECQRSHENRAWVTIENWSGRNEGN
jgi:predicted dehydrogenase